MGRLEVGAGRDREATPGLEAVSPGPTEEYCQGGDGARAGQGPPANRRPEYRGRHAEGAIGQRPHGPRLVKVKAS